jgi:hypothetical protein
MAAVSNNVRNPKPDRHLTKPRIEAVDETVEITLQPEVLKRVTAAAKASGQSTSEWIHEAVVEAVKRRTPERRDHPEPKH